MRLADKMEALSSSIFVKLAEKRAEAEQRGMEVIDLSVGTPDLSPPVHVMAAMKNALDNPDNYKYAITDRPSLIEAAREWYVRRYGVWLSADEICTLNGSQDGLSHLPLVVMNPGDIALVPNPGYPIFRGGPLIASGRIFDMPLTEDSGFLPDLKAIPADVCARARLMVLSYPANPIGKLAPPEFFEEAIWFARKHGIVIMHDNAYSELVYDGKRAGSFLSFPGAAEVGIEFNSLSKSYNMTGMRISFALGSKRIVSALRSFKSNIDYGVFPAVQAAAEAALRGSQDFVFNLRETYEKRRDALVSGLSAAGWNIDPSEATMFAWAKLPEGYTSSMDFCMDMIERAGVMFVPGIAFGSLGEGYVRIALVQPESVIRRACARISVTL